MSMAEAKDLHADITRLLIRLQELQEAATARDSEEVITVQVTGGSF